MKKKYSIRYLPLFYRDLEKIVNYIINDLENVIAANDLVVEIQNEINRRAYNPECFERYASL